MTGIKESFEYINKFDIFGMKFSIPGLDDHYFTIILMMLIDYLIVFFILWLATNGRKMRPNKTQNLIEIVILYITDMADNIIGEKGHRYYALMVTLFFYILVGNLMGLIPGLISPTSSLSVTAALAIMIFFWEWISGFVTIGPLKFFAHYAGPPGIPFLVKCLLVPIEFLSDIARPVSLMFRLFGNIMAKEILLGVLVLLTVLFAPTAKENIISAIMTGFAGALRPLIIWLGILVSLVQAIVFTMLTAVYISAAVSSGHGEEHEAEHAH